MATPALFCRWNATSNPWRPDLACFDSHIAVLAEGLRLGAPFLLVLEDDAILPSSTAVLHSAVQQSAVGPWDVLMLGYTHFDLQPPAIRKSWGVSAVKRALGGTAYVVRHGYLPSMLQWLQQGRRLLEEHNDPTRFALDTWWVGLQQRDVWVAVTPPAAFQASSWSTIEGRHEDREGTTRGWMQAGEVVCPRTACLPSWVGYPAWCLCDSCIAARWWVRFRHSRDAASSQALWAYTMQAA